MTKQELERVVEDYEYAEIVSNADARNKAFRKADAADMPVMWLEPRQKYGKVDTDFITTDGDCRGLNETAYENLKELNDQFMGMTLRKVKESHRSDVYATTSTYTPGMDGLLITDMAEYSRTLAELIYDTQNWEIEEPW